MNTLSLQLLFDRHEVIVTRPTQTRRASYRNKINATLKDETFFLQKLNMILQRSFMRPDRNHVFFSFMRKCKFQVNNCVPKIRTEKKNTILCKMQTKRKSHNKCGCTLL